MESRYGLGDKSVECHLSIAHALRKEVLAGVIIVLHPFAMDLGFNSLITKAISPLKHITSITTTTFSIVIASLLIDWEVI
ncbi:MAG: hypothetical protein J7J01_03065 [Methanophagales archaeon]|nr:hypothetical protein [Methanophagales archaeon]MCW7070090.1 hypothetical protein [Methanophagales archaeon]